MAASAPVHVLLCRDAVAVDQGLAKYIRERPAGVPPMLILYVGSDDAKTMMSESSQGHQYSANRRNPMALRDAARDPPLVYLLTIDRFGEMDVNDCEVVLFQGGAVRESPRLQVQAFLLILTMRLFLHFRETPVPGFEYVFRFSQRSAFTRLAYAVNSLVLGRERVNWPRPMPFPDMRRVAGADRDDLIAAVRAWGEQPACECCGAVLRCGMARNLCCGRVEGRLSAQLPPAMRDDVLRHVLRHTEDGPNCPRSRNAAMRSVIQNANVRSPRGGGEVLYEGAAVTGNQRLQYYAGSRVSSAPESFAAICGFWCHHMRPTVMTLRIHRPAKKSVMATGNREPVDLADLPRQLERYFGRPDGAVYAELTYAEYYSIIVSRAGPMIPLMKMDVFPIASRPGGKIVPCAFSIR
jgi:hypothetical protein